MAEYIIEMDSSVHADATAAQTAITSAGGSITKTYSFSLTYKVECEPAEYDAINGKKYGELVSAEKVVTPAFNTNHLKMMCNKIGETTVTYNAQSSGNGEHVYLLDTGVNTVHDEFSGATVNNLYTNFSTDFNDSDGHGTVMASLIVGQNIGTAKDATLHNVRMMNSNPYTGTVGAVIDALDAVSVHHNANTPSQTKTVVCCWTTSKNSLIDSKIAQLENNNLVVVAAAGNDGADTDNYSPAGLDSVLTVGAMNINGHVAEIDGGKCNLGEENDIYALGDSVSVINFTDNSAYTTASGTSVAAAQIGGLVAQYTDLYPNADSFQTKSYVIAEGMVEFKGTAVTFDSTLVTETGVDATKLKESIGVSPQVDDVTISPIPSGIVLTVQNGQSANANLMIYPDTVNVEMSDFSPLPPFATITDGSGNSNIDIRAGEVYINVDTSDASNMANVTLPAIFHFSIKGNRSNVVVIEEYSVGVYNTSENELYSAPEYYYDSEEASYDQVVNFNAAKNLENNAPIGLGKYLLFHGGL